EMQNKNMAVRAGFKLMHKARPDLVDQAMRELLPEFVATLEPHYRESLSKPGRSFRAYLQSHNDAVVAALLTVTDLRMARAGNRIIIKGYRGLRRRAEQEVVAALPGIIEIIARYVDQK